MSATLQQRLQSTLGATYSIERELGAGGMSRVFVAEELALGRKVVVKVLAPELVEGAGAERFAREIRVAARLQEPHIVPLLSAGLVPTDDAAVPYYTMPFIEGESLRHRLERGSLPIDEAVGILRDLAIALEYAHAQGVVHRDIKPENVLLSGRTAMVTDFGIARALGRARNDGTRTADTGGTGRSGGSPTALTAAGSALGTPAYMAPEQIAGDEVDHRADIYAWGVVAYELLAGRHPFAGKSTAQQLLAAHLAETASPLTSDRPDVPPALGSFVDRCLAKDPAARPQRTAEVVNALAGYASDPNQRALRPVTTSRWRTTWPIAALLGVAATGGVGYALSRAPGPYVAGATTQVTSSPDVERDPVISPDGQRVAFASTVGGRTIIHVRQIDGGRVVALTADLEGSHRAPAWSPDGTRIAFMAGLDLFEVPALGGTPRRLVAASTSSVLSPAWSRDGKWLAYADRQGLWVRAVDGGTPRLVVEGRELYSPTWSPDDQWLAYVAGNPGYADGNLASSAIGIVRVRDGATVTIREATRVNASPAWSGDGRTLFFVSNEGGTQDIYQLRLRRDKHPDGPAQRLTTGSNAFLVSTSADGKRLAYGVRVLRSNIWSIPIPAVGTDSAAAARSARADARQHTFEQQRIEGVSLSADGRRLIYDSNRGGNQDIYQVSIDGGEPVRLTMDGGEDFHGRLSRNGEEIAFHSMRHGSRDLFVMRSDGRDPERVTTDAGNEYMPDWSPDGRSLVFSANPNGKYSVYTITRQASGRWSSPRRIAPDEGDQRRVARWSPDGRWIAYRSGRSLRVVGADGDGARTLIPDGLTSTGYIEWSDDGSTIYLHDTYGGPHQFATVPAAGGPMRTLLRLGTPDLPSARHEFAVGGRRFYFTVPTEEGDVWVMDLSR